MVDFKERNKKYPEEGNVKSPEQLNLGRVVLPIRSILTILNFLDKSSRSQNCISTVDPEIYPRNKIYIQIEYEKNK